MGFESLDPDVDVLLLEDISTCSVSNVTLTGPLGTADLDTDANDTAGIRFASTASLVCNNITIDRCVFSGTTYGVATEQEINSTTVSNSKFNTLYKGVALGISSPVNGGPTGTRILQNLFDNIYAQGIEMGAISLNGTGYNIFYDVGNHFDGITNPATTIIDIDGDNNVCVGDMFERGDAYSGTYVRINTNSKAVISTHNGKLLEVGTYGRNAGISSVLVANTASATTIFSNPSEAFSVNYTIQRDTNKRTGILTVSNDGLGNISYTDDYTQTASTGVTLSVVDNAGSADVKYVYPAVGANGSISYSIYTTL
jgi:hypothetical protein